jgi:hypothetical protein
MYSYLRYLTITLAFNALTIATAVLIFLKGHVGVLTEDVMLYFDSVHYFNIRENGYAASFETAFFPLFPYVWKISGLSLNGISIFNGLLYSTTVSMVGYSLRLSVLQYLAVLALPSTLFFFIPYSEAVYYACGTLLLLGVQRKNVALQLLGLFISCFARPTLPVISGAFVLYHFFSGRKMMAVYGVMVAVLGTLAAFTVHWSFTGNLFSYFSAFKTWDYNFKFPLLPFQSHGGNAIKQYDSYALLLGILSLALALRSLFGRLTLRDEEKFGLFYISGFTLLILGLLRGGDISSLNRFLFCSPFFVVSLMALEQHIIVEKGWRSFLLLWAGFTTFSLLFSSYVHIEVMLRYTAGAMMLASYLTLGNWRPWGVRISSILFILTLTCTQIFMMIRFLSSEWVG